MARRKSISTKQIHAPHWDNHEVVVIRSLTTEDEEIIADSITEITAEGKVSVHAGRTKRLTILRGIVSWTFTDEQGKQMKLDEQSIKSLAPEDSQYILDEINRLGAPMTTQEKKDSSMNATTGTADAAQ